MAQLNTRIRKIIKRTASSIADYRGILFAIISFIE